MSVVELRSTAGQSVIVSDLNASYLTDIALVTSENCLHA